MLRPPMHLKRKPVLGEAIKTCMKICAKDFMYNVWQFVLICVLSIASMMPCKRIDINKLMRVMDVDACQLYK